MPKTIDRQSPIKRHKKVVAAVDLPGVPEGTGGKVKVANGMRWYRYWVDFDNGVTLGSVSHDHLAHKADWPQFRIDREAIASGAVVAEGDDTGGDTAAGGGGGNAFGVPEYLLERSKAARARLTGG
jgi:hypothetical protein